MSPSNRSTNSPPAPSDTAVREQLRQILASSGFLAHPRACVFLSHVVERTLAGRTEEIKEVTIGVDAFGRLPSYDPKSDPIVRSVARVVREKLNSYYRSPSADSVRIDLPKGCYVPEFRSLPAVPPDGRADNMPLAAAFGIFEKPRWLPAGASLAGVALAVLVVLIFWAKVKHFPKTVDADSKRATAAALADPETLYRLGRERLLVGDYPGARPLLERAAALSFQDARVHATLADDLRLLGYDSGALDEGRRAEAATGGLPESDELEVEASFRTAAGDYNGALEALSRLRRLHPDGLQYLRQIAQVQAYSSSFSACLSTLALARQSIGRDAEEDPQVSLMEALCTAGSGNYESALKPVRRAAFLAVRIGAQEIYARSRLLEAGLLMSTGHVPESRPIREEARRICAALGDLSCVVHALRVQANLDLATVGPATALNEYMQALPLARETGAAAETLNILNGAGIAKGLMDDFDGADAAFVEALLIAQHSGGSAAGVRISQADAAILEGRLARAAALAGQSASDARKGGDKNTEIVARLVQAKAMLLTLDLGGAQDSLDRVSETARGVMLPNATTGLWKLSTATLSRLTGNLERAESQLQEAGSANDPSIAVEIGEERIELLLDQHRYKEAQQVAGTQLAGLANTGRKSDAARITALLSDAYGYNGNLQAAREAAKSASSLVSSRSAPLARMAVLISLGRWAANRAAAGPYLDEAIGLAKVGGFRLAEYEARFARLGKHDDSGDAASGAAMLAIISEMNHLGARSIANRALRK